MLLHAHNSDDFPAVAGYDLLLSYPQLRLDEDTKKTLESYERNSHLKPDNFLSKEGLDEKITILSRNPQQADELFKETDDWILPKMQHDALRKLKEEYLKALLEPKIQEEEIADKASEQELGKRKRDSNEERKADEPAEQKLGKRKIDDPSEQKLEERKAGDPTTQIIATSNSLLSAEQNKQI